MSNASKRTGWLTGERAEARLRYRLRRISDITDLDLSDPRQLLALQLLLAE